MMNNHEQNQIIADDAIDEKGQMKHIILTILTGIVTLFGVAVLLGAFTAHFEDGGGVPSAKFTAVSIAIFVATAVSGYFFIKLSRRSESLFGAMTKKDKRGRNTLIVAMLIGAVTGMGLVLASPDRGENAMAVFSNAPLPPIAALIIAFVWGVIVPILSIYRHITATDEQERYATGQAGVWSLFYYMLIAPLWWILWRGGFVPEPNGIVIYMTTILLFGILWIKFKYL